MTPNAYEMRFNKPIDTSMVPVMNALRDNDIECVASFIEDDVELLRKYDAGGDTLLFNALDCELPEMILMLVDAGADVTQLNEQGQSIGDALARKMKLHGCEDDDFWDFMCKCRDTNPRLFDCMRFTLRALVRQLNDDNDNDTTQSGEMK